jgi:hypothetical protein
MSDYYCPPVVPGTARICASGPLRLSPDLVIANHFTFSVNANKTKVRLYPAEPQGATLRFPNVMEGGHAIIAFLLSHPGTVRDLQDWRELRELEVLR